MPEKVFLCREPAADPGGSKKPKTAPAKVCSIDQHASSEKPPLILGNDLRAASVNLTTLELLSPAKLFTSCLALPWLRNVALRCMPIMNMLRDLAVLLAMHFGQP